MLISRLAIRVLDILGAIVGIIVFAPVVFLAVLLIRWESRGTPILRQARLGKGGRVFNMFKLRTMHDNAERIFNSDGSTYTGTDDPRVTRVGRVLRRYSVDEIPQFLNVLLGQMSLVGPRPDLAEQLRDYDEFRRERLRVKPGMTGLAMVEGRNALELAERTKLDVQYARDPGLGQYLGILVRTVSIVLRGAGVNAAGQASSRY